MIPGAPTIRWRSHEGRLRGRSDPFLPGIPTAGIGATYPLGCAPAKVGSPPNLAVRRRSLEWHVCAVEPPFIAPAVNRQGATLSGPLLNGASPAVRTGA